MSPTYFIVLNDRDEAVNEDGHTKAESAHATTWRAFHYGSWDAAIKAAELFSSKRQKSHAVVKMVLRVVYEPRTVRQEFA